MIDDNPSSPWNQKAVFEHFNVILSTEPLSLHVERCKAFIEELDREASTEWERDDLFAGF